MFSFIDRSTYQLIMHAIKVIDQHFRLEDLSLEIDLNEVKSDFNLSFLNLQSTIDRNSSSSLNMQRMI